MSGYVYVVNAKLCQHHLSAKKGTDCGCLLLRLMTPEEALSSENSLRGPAPDSQFLLNAINAFVKEGASSAAAVRHIKTQKKSLAHGAGSHGHCKHVV
jgi:hypothetical protein